jgi:hypothetical protein
MEWNRDGQTDKGSKVNEGRKEELKKERETERGERTKFYSRLL